jgi:hypothetical protein
LNQGGKKGLKKCRECPIPLREERSFDSSTDPKTPLSIHPSIIAAVKNGQSGQSKEKKKVMGGKKKDQRGPTAIRTRDLIHTSGFVPKLELNQP